jgi:hypothetical protein
MSDAIDEFTVVHSPAGKQMVSSHESQRRVSPRKQDLWFGVPAYDDAGGRGFGFGRHRFPSSFPERSPANSKRLKDWFYRVGV